MEKQLNRRKFLKSVGMGGAAIAFSSLSTSGFSQESNKEKINIVFILADDMGHGDLSTYNPDSLVPMPNVRRLAEEGMQFSNAYCPDAICTPTRYSLMTGRYCWRTHLKSSVLANWEPPLIERDRLTLPGMLKMADYHTAGLGKWHLGAKYKTTDGKPPTGMGKWGSKEMGANLDLSAGVKDGPLERGFDSWYGFICASETLVFDQNRAVGWFTDKQAVPAKTITDALPPMEVSEFLPEITRRAVDYIDERAKSDQPFFLYFAPYVPHVPLAVEEKFRGKTQAGDYGDYVHELDHYTGVVLDALEKTGQAENTLVLFASDNGSQFTQSGEGHKPNAPFSGRKKMVLEGGVRTPLVVRWPGRIAAGSQSDQLIALNDIIATVAGIIDVKIPDAMAEDSFDMSGVLMGESSEGPRDCVVVKSRAHLYGLREGKWKYIDGPGTGLGKRGGRDELPAQLYDLNADPKEEKNLLSSYPEVAERLKARLDAIMQGDGQAK